MNDIEIIKEYLLGRERAFTSSSNIIMRCPFCGDPKSTRSANFSVRVDIEEKEPFLYQCFRADCQAIGLLTPEVLQTKFFCGEMDILLALSRHNSKVDKKIKKFNGKIKRDLRIINLANNELNAKKLDYVNKRLGQNLSIKDLKDFKIQLDLLEFLTMNNIRKYTMDPKFVEKLSTYSVGFLSAFEDYVICRTLNSSMFNNRYIIYPIAKIVDNIGGSLKFYIKPTQIDLLSDKASELHIAEGVLSILGAYFHSGSYPSDRNVLFIANCGAGYLNSISTTIKQYGLTKVRINIYSDSEIALDYYKKIKEKLSFITVIKEFNVHYNTLKEDFGYPASDIKITTYKL
jgi:hypothetical protein